MRLVKGEAEAAAVGSRFPGDHRPPVSIGDDCKPVPDHRRSTAELADQGEVIGFLADPATHGGAKPIERFETHGNLVFLAGTEAWKIKRAVRFPYMDFSTLEKRQAACAREVEINRRFAPELYLGSVPITRSAGGGLALGGSGEIVEWAVHMRRFEQAALLSHIAQWSGIGPDLANALADVVFDSHHGADRAVAASGAAPLDALVTSLGSSLSERTPSPGGCYRLWRARQG